MGSGLVQPRQGIHNPLLNSGAAVVQCKVSKPSDLRVSWGSKRTAICLGDWWSITSLFRIRTVKMVSKLPSAYSDRGYAFPRKIKGDTGRYFQRGCWSG